MGTLSCLLKNLDRDRGLIQESEATAAEEAVVFLFPIFDGFVSVVSFFSRSAPLAEAFSKASFSLEGHHKSNGFPWVVIGSLETGVREQGEESKGMIEKELFFFLDEVFEFFSISDLDDDKKKRQGRKTRIPFSLASPLSLVQLSLSFFFATEQAPSLSLPISRQRRPKDAATRAGGVVVVVVAAIFNDQCRAATTPLLPTPDLLQADSRGFFAPAAQWHCAHAFGKREQQR